MKDIIKEIQEEINQLMVSKIAKFTDKQLENWSNNETPYETVMEMYQLHLSGMSVTQIAKKYGYKSSEKLTEKFDRHGLKYEKMNSRHGNPKRKKPVDQYSLDGKYIQTFESLLKASESSNVKVCSISLAASGKTKTSGGFIWKYKN
jgi:methyltransferase-like protein